LYGPSGSGKTTLLLLAAGVLEGDVGGESVGGGVDLERLGEGGLASIVVVMWGSYFSPFI
jgi:ABC-type lipoprotein export system ATPase subunit